MRGEVAVAGAGHVAHDDDNNKQQRPKHRQRVAVAFGPDFNLMPRRD